MNNEMPRLWDMLRLIYGTDMIAATVVVLVKDGDTAVRYVTNNFPQEEEK
jgi:hypothetical protein